VVSSYLSVRETLKSGLDKRDSFSTNQPRRKRVVTPCSLNHDWLMLRKSYSFWRKRRNFDRKTRDELKYLNLKINFYTMKILSTKCSPNDFFISCFGAHAGGGAEKTYHKMMRR